MRSRWSFLARDYRHNPDGTHTILNTFDTAVVKGPPYNIGPCILVVAFEIPLDELDKDVDIEVVVAYGNSNMRVYSRVHEWRTPDFLRWAHHVEIMSWPFSIFYLDDAGEYTFRIHVNGEVVSVNWFRILDWEEAK